MRRRGGSSPEIGEFFEASAEFWLGLQGQYDLDVAAEELGDRLEREVKTLVSTG